MRAFLRQPVAPYRDFQIAYGVLAANFLVPAATYLVDARGTAARVDALSRALGEVGWPSPEDSVLWHALGVSDVFTLGFLCVWLMLDLRRHIAALPALVVLKALTAAQFLAAFARDGHALFLGIGLFDAATTMAFVLFAVRAWRALPDADDALIPRPVRWFP
jgi:hypothetical protein